MVNMSRIFELICISHTVLRIMKTSTFTTKKRNNFQIMDFLAQMNQLPELPQKYFIVQDKDFQASGLDQPEKLESL